MPLRDNSRGGSEVIGCSVRGQKSVDKGVPCQDDNAKRALAGNRYIIAAADGLGSASLSHIGSDTATRAVADYLEDAVAGIGPLDEETLLPMLREAFVHAREQLHRKAESLDESVSALNTTLLVAVGGPNGVGGAAVGDGGVVLHRGGQTGLVVPREETEYENETIPLQSDSWDQSYRSRWVADADAAAVFSDGLDGVAWSGPASVSDELFDQVFNSLREYSDFDELEAFLEEFLDGESLRRSSRDDKTLAVGTIPVALWTDPAEAAPIDNPSVTPSETGSSSPNPGSAQGGRSATAGSQPTGQRLNDVRGEQTVTSGRLGGNPNRRRRRIVSLAGIGVMVLLVGVLAATLFLGSSGNSVDGIDVSTAELQGTEGIIVEGTVNGTQDTTLTVSVWEGERDNGTPLISEQKQVNSEPFSFELSPDEPETEKKEFDYYGETEYEVVVEAADGTNSTVPVERGELRLAFTDVNVTDGEIRGSGTLTQGGQPVHEEAKPEVTYDAGSELDVEYHSSNATFQFSGEGDLSPGTDITATFADRTETVTTAEFEVTSLTLPDEIVEGDSIRVEYEVENTGDVQATQDIKLSVNGTSGGTESGVTLNGSERFSGQFNYTTGSADTPAVTVAVTSGDDSASETVTVTEPASFEVRITSVDEAVTEGETITVAYEVTNTGDVADTQDIGFAVNGTAEDTASGVTLNGSETVSDQFSYDTVAGDAPTVSVAVSSADDSASATVTVQGSDESGGDDGSSKESGEGGDDSQLLSASNEGTIVVANTVSHGRQAGTTATGSSGRQNRGQAWHPGDGSTSVGTEGA